MGEMDFFLGGRSHLSCPFSLWEDIFARNTFARMFISSEGALLAVRTVPHFTEQQNWKKTNQPASPGGPRAPGTPWAPFGPGSPWGP